MEMNDDEVEIDLVDMLADLFRKWRYILAGLLVGVILIGAPLTYKQYRQIQSKYSDESLYTIQGDMTKEEVETVRQLFNRYETFRRRIENNQNYMDHSIMMKMDPNNVSNYSVNYVFESDQRTAVDYFQDFSLNYDDYKLIAQILGNDADPRYAYEVLNIMCTAAPDSQIIDGDMPDKIIVNGDISNKYRGLVKLRIKASNKEQCEKIAEIVDKAFSNAVKELTDTGIFVKMSQSGVNYTESVDTDLVEKQQEQIALGSELVSSYNAFEKDYKASLSPQGQELFDYWVHHEDRTKPRLSWKKYVVIGGFAGAAAVAFILCLVYIVAGDFKTVDEISRYTGVKLIGFIQQENKSYRGLDKLFLGIARKLESRGRITQQDGDAIAVTATRIVEYCKQKQIDYIFISQDNTSEYTKSITEKMAEHLRAYIRKVEIGEPLKKSDDLKRLHSCKLVVRMITLKMARRRVLCEIQEMCSEVNIPLFGDIIVVEV